MLGILASMDQKDSCSGMYKAGFSGDSAPRAVFLPFVRPKMLRIMASTFWEMTRYFLRLLVFGSLMFGAVA